MPPTDKCPTMEVLRRLALGQLEQIELESVTPHVEGCALCEQKLRSITADDTLHKALPKASSKSHESDTPKEVDGDATEAHAGPRKNSAAKPPIAIPGYRVIKRLDSG